MLHEEQEKEGMLRSPQFPLLFLLFSSLRKSSSTVLLHFGHFGSTSDNMTYMRHRGHPTSNIGVESGLLGHCKVSSGSDETHEPSIDMSEEKEVETFGDSSGEFALGGDKFSLKSSSGLFGLRLIFVFAKTPFAPSPSAQYFT